MCSDTTQFGAVGSVYPGTACPRALTLTSTSIRYQHRQQLTQPLAKETTGPMCAGELAAGVIAGSK